jgi:hypothetical protein
MIQVRAHLGAQPALSNRVVWVAAKGYRPAVAHLGQHATGIRTIMRASTRDSVMIFAYLWLSLKSAKSLKTLPGIGDRPGEGMMVYYRLLRQQVDEAIARRFVLIMAHVGVARPGSKL